MSAPIRVGFGYDVHQWAADRPLILGGICIPYELGLAGHSDADVLAHAITDALLGAAALGDIGQHFPDTDPQYKDADSIELLKHVTGLLREKDFQIGNIDATVVAERPKLASFIPSIREKLAQSIGMEISDVSVKATTTEGLLYTGSPGGMAAYAVCTLICER